jgi:hypothetical protein
LNGELVLRRTVPAVSEQQRKWAFAVKGEKWARAHHFDNKGPLPEHADRRTRLAKQFIAKHRKARRG